jgi:integrase
MSKPLTAFAIAAIKPGAVRREIPDGQVQGLRIVVQPSGAMSWALRYRFHGKPAKLTIGPWPAIDLKSARALAQKAHVEIAEGGDPCAAKREKKAEAQLPQAVTVKAALADFIRLYAKGQTRSWQETERILGEFSKSWEGRPMASISRGDVHKVLDEIMARGAPIMANQAFAHFRAACTWAVSRGIIDASPCAGIAMPAKAQSRDRVLSDGELAAVWRAADALGFPYRDVIHLLILTGQRRSEVAGMCRQEIDMGAKLWTIPAARTKNGRRHELPLSGQAVAILESLPRFHGSDYVFGERPPSGFSKVKVRLDRALPADQPPWVIHDLRRSVASGLGALGVDLHVTERCLNHVSGSFAGIVGVYQRHDFAKEKRAAMDAWGRHVDALASGEGSNVIEIGARRG